MPTTLVAAIFFGGDLILMGAALGTFGVAAASFAMSYALSQVISRAFAPNQQTGTNKSIDNGVRLQGPPSNTNSIPVVYGDAYLGGIFTDAVLTTNQKTMYYVMTVSAISPNGQFFFDTTKFYFADRLITFDTTDLTKVVTLTDGAGQADPKIAGNLYIGLYTSTQAGVITSLNGAALPHVFMGGADIDAAQRWPSTGRQMNGLAFAIIKLNYSRAAQTTQLQAVTFRAQHYLNGTGAAKPGDVWYDYMTNETYGAAMDTTIVDSTTATALNSYSDALISYTPSGGGTATQARYRINGVIDAGLDCLQNIDRIMTACDSWTQYNATTGKWAIVINKAEATSFAFNDSNIMSDIRVSSYDLTSSINQIQASFPNKTNRDQTDYVYIETPSGLLYPNEPVNKLSITLDLVNDSVQAQYLANRQLEQAREDLIVTFSTPYPGIQVDAGDVVSVTNADYGWTDKLFRVMKVAEQSHGMGNLFATLDLIEYNAQVYDDLPITQYTPAANSNLASPSYFSALAAPTVVNQLPSAIVPTFDVTVYIPAVGRVTMFTLFYTTVATPSPGDWLVYATQTNSTSDAYTPSTNFTFTNIQMPNGTYYFATKVQNEFSASLLSAQSTALVWSPNPTSTAVAGTFVATFAPATTLVPRNSSLVPQFTGLITQLYGSAAGGSIDFVTAQTDSAGSFTNNTWRIGGSSTTGNGDIVTTGGLTLSTPTDGGTYAQWAIPTAMASSPATLTVPVRYKSALGTVTQGANAILQWTFVDPGANGTPGTSGNQTATTYLYQWATTQPSNPTGTSTYTWATGANTSYSGLYSWSVTVPVNPGTAGLSLWIATKQVVAAAGTVSTSVDWTTGVGVYAYSTNGANGTPGTNGTNGANGLQTATPVVYQWAITIPVSPSGTSTYTWASGSFTPTPSGWSQTITTSPSAGYTLWAARVTIVDTATATTSTINWGLSSIVASGYAGTTGTPGTNGTNGIDGLSSRICYAKSTVNPLSSTPATVTVAGSGTFPPYNTWGGGETWVATPMALVAGESMFQSDGIYNPSTGNTVWNVPYLSNLKVGSLSAISANMGTITAGDLSIGSSPALSGTTMTGTGSHLYASGNFAFGNPTTNMVFDGSSVYLNGFADNSSSNVGGVTTFNNYDTVSFQTFDITKASQATYGIAGNQRIGTNNLTVVSLRFIMNITLRQSMPATSIVAGQGYIVRTIGTTNYTTCGGTNTVGRFFTATATPTGSGTVWPEIALVALEREIWATPGRFSSSLQLTGGFSFSSTRNFAVGTYDICLSQSYAEGYTAAGNAVVGAVLYSSASAVSSFIFASRI